MAYVITDNANYTAIASQIRAKNGTNTTYRPDQMAAAIAALPNAANLDIKTITENGTYLASADSLDGYSSVTVNVSGGGGGGGADGVYYGEADPTSDIGSDGDSYFQYFVAPEFIAGDGASWIHTKLQGVSTYSYEVKAALLSDTSGKGDAIFGGMAGNSKAYLRFLPDSGQLQHCRAADNNVKTAYYYTATETKDDFVGEFKVFESTRTSLLIDGVQVTTYAQTTASSALGAAILLFAMGGNNTNSTYISDPQPIADSIGVAAISYFKAFDANGTLIRHLVPFVDGQGAVCMKNVLDGELYYNGGTGTFVHSESGTKIVRRQWQKVNGAWQALYQ